MTDRHARTNLNQGRKGAGWVAVQFALMVLTVALGFVGGWPGAVEGSLDVAGALLLVVGASIVAWSAKSLGSALTPFPRPRGELVTTGPYRRVRHPIYSGAIVFFAGWSLLSSPVALLGTAALTVLWDRKGRYEERLLGERYPGYAAYSARVRHRLVPFVW